MLHVQNHEAFLSADVACQALLEGVYENNKAADARHSGGLRRLSLAWNRMGHPDAPLFGFLGTWNRMEPTHRLS